MHPCYAKYKTDYTSTQNPARFRKDGETCSEKSSNIQKQVVTQCNLYYSNFFRVITSAIKVLPFYVEF